MPTLHWVSRLRVLATLLVVALHSAGSGLVRFGKIRGDYWWVCDAVGSLGRFAVPIFVMLSGYLLLGRYTDLGTFITKRLRRIALPFLGWAVIYLAYYWFVEKNPMSIGTMLSKLLTGDIARMGHLWFVFMLIGLYAFVPVISRWIASAPQVEISFFLGISLIVSVLYPIITKFTGLKIAYDFVNFSGYAGYFILGYWLGNVPISSPKNIRIIAWIALLGGLCATMGATYFSSLFAGKIDVFWLEYFRPNVVLMAVGIFLLFRLSANSPSPNWITFLDENSYGVYLAHLLVLRNITLYTKINYATIHPSIGIALHTGLTVLVCLGIIWTLRRFSFTRWLAG